LISSGSSFGKVFVKNSNSLLLLRFFEVSVDWSVILVADYPIFKEEIFREVLDSVITHLMLVLGFRQRRKT